MASLLLKMDKVIDDWARGKLSNTELRDGIKALGGKVLNPRITASMHSGSLEIAMPSGKIVSDFRKGGKIKKTRAYRKVK